MKLVLLIIFLALRSSAILGQARIYYPNHVDIIEDGHTQSSTGISGLKIVIDEKAKKISTLNTSPKYKDYIYRITNIKASPDSKDTKIYKCLMPIAGDDTYKAVVYISVNSFYKTIKWAGTWPLDSESIDQNKYMVYQYR